MGLRRALPPLAFGLLAIGYMVVASGFSDDTSAEAPMLYGEVMLGLSVLMGALAVFPAAGKPPTQPEPPRGAWLASVQIYAVIAGFIALIFLAGFYVAITVFLFLFLWLWSRLSVPHALLFAAGACGFTWLVFGYSLNLTMFSGYLVRLL